MGCIYFGNYWQSDTNGDFYNAAFSETEQNAINITNIDSDKIYLLSIDDITGIQYGFDDIFEPETRISTNTLYAKTCGALTKDGDVGYWWIYCKWEDNKTVADWFDTVPRPVNDPTGAVRPCLHIDLSSLTWTKAGTVCSNGEITDKSIAELTTTTEATTTIQHVIQIPQVTTPTTTYIVFPVTASTTTQAPQDKTKPTVKGVKNKKIYKKR